MRGSRALVIGAAVSGLVLVGCSSSGSTSTSAAAGASQPTASAAGNLPTVVIGSINGLTGPVVIKDASEAANAVFERYDASPHRVANIRYVPLDDGADPAKAAADARQLINSGAVLLAGGGSAVQCTANKSYYVQQGIADIEGVGIPDECFDSPNIAPVNTGPFVGIQVSLTYMSQVLKLDKICYLQIQTGTNPNSPLAAAAVSRWEAATGHHVVLKQNYLPTADLTPLAIRVKQAGCNGVVDAGVAFTALGWNQVATQQGLTAVTIDLSSAYTDAVATQLATSHNVTYVNSEFEPYSSDSADLADFKALMKSVGIAPSAFAEGGYVAALIAIDALEHAGLAKGDSPSAERAKVLHYLHTMPPYHTPLMGTPYVFGTGQAHNPNTASKFVKATGGKWQVVTPGWVIVPAS